MPIQKTDYIWFNGKFVQWNSAIVHVLTHSLHYGSGAFEGIRCYETPLGPAVFRLKEHVQRMFDSAGAILMKIPFKPAEIEDAIKQTIKKNLMKSCYIRPLAIYGYGEMNLNTTKCPVDIIISVWPWGAYLGKEGMEKGIKVSTSRFRREVSELSSAKITGSYYKSSLAKREALAKGFDEALMLDSEGNVAEGSGENIFIVNGKTIKTPPLGAILPGITRDSVIQMAKSMGYGVIEENFGREELYSANEVFFTGTAAEITPVRQVDSKIIGLGKRGKVTEALQNEFFEIVKGRKKEYHKWLSFV